MCLGKKPHIVTQIFKVPRLLHTHGFPLATLTYLRCSLSASWHWSASSLRQGLLFPWPQRQLAQTSAVCSLDACVPVSTELTQ